MNLLLRKPVIGITLGDPAGIGAEVTAKALRLESLRRKAQFVIIGDRSLTQRYFNGQFSNCKFFDLQELKTSQLQPGRPNRYTAQASYQYLEIAVALRKRKLIDAIVTAPVSKEEISSLGKKFHGHTEFLANAFGVKKFEMLFVSPHLRTIIVTRHVPLKDVSQLITKEKVYSTIQLADQALKRYFKIQRPKIGVCGLNPHAGEDGLIGNEELKAIIPAIQKAKRSGIQVSGPFAADTIFNVHHGKKYDVLIAMYHDQGLIAVKTFHFDHLVNFTIGLPFIRTSPAHGTAFDIAGKNQANPSSMKVAIELAVDLSRKSSSL